VDEVKHNSMAWDAEAQRGERWSVPISREQLENARKSGLGVLLTPNTPIPEEWLIDARDRQILCLGGGGGQQAPLLATVGPTTSFDNSGVQLNLDVKVAQENDLDLKVVKGDMADLGVFENGFFDLIVNPCSTCFVPDLAPVWQECYRVLAPGGTMISGHLNPIYFMIDHDRIESSEQLEITRPVPYADTAWLSKEELDSKVANLEPLTYGHTLTQLIGGQLSAGFTLIDMFEDNWDEEATRLHLYGPVYLVTRTKKSR
jgi:SAM-dependent methyltransferase